MTIMCAKKLLISDSFNQSVFRLSEEEAEYRPEKDKYS